MNEFKKMRRSLYMTQSEIAKELGVAMSLITKWENGFCKPLLNNRKKIVDFCNKHNVPVPEFK